MSYAATDNDIWKVNVSVRKRPLRERVRLTGDKLEAAARRFLTLHAEYSRRRAFDKQRDGPLPANVYRKGLTTPRGKVRLERVGCTGGPCAGKILDLDAECCAGTLVFTLAGMTGWYDNNGRWHAQGAA